MKDNVKQIDDAAYQIREGRIEVNSLFANYILQTCPYKGQRKTQEGHVDKWVAMLTSDSGEFLRDQGISFGQLNGVLYLVNGKHRLTAVRKSGVTTSFDITIFLVANEAELAQLYARFDSEALSRNLKDIVANDRMVTPKFPAARLAQLCIAVVQIETRFKNVGTKKLPPVARIKERRLESARGWYKEAQRYIACSANVPATKVSRFFGGVPMAVGLVTLRHQPVRAEAFWTRAMRDDGLRVGDPVRAMLDAWSRPNANWNRYQMGLIAAMAWNADFDGESMKIVRPKEGQLIEIAGTPY